MLYKLTEDKLSKKTSYCGGLLTIKESKTEDDKVIRLFGLQIFRKKKRLKPTKTNLLNAILKKAPNYDDYYIFTSRSGEFYLFMHHLDEILTKNNSKNYLLVFTAKYHAQIFTMLHPNNNNFIYQNEPQGYYYNDITRNTHIKFANKNFYIPFFTTYFQSVENKIRNEGNHYYECLKSHLQLTDAQKITPYIDDENKNKIKKYATHSLNNNFIFLSPESQSNVLLEKTFWTKLTNELTAKGYKIFNNIIDDSNKIENTETTFLTFPQALELAQYAKAIIGLRSGFIETIASYKDKPYHILYTNFPQRGHNFAPLKSDKVLSGFSLKKLPNINPENIFEYDLNKIKEDDIIKEIVSNL